MRKLALICLLFGILVSCGEDQINELIEDTKGPLKGRLKAYLRQSQANIDAVFIDIQSVEISAKNDSSSDWSNILENPVRLNILDLANNLDTLLGDYELDAGNYSQIRLILGDNNTVVVNGEEKELKTPSAQQSGLKLKLNATIEEGVTYTIGFDFDAAKSIVTTGNAKNPKYNLKPVIRLITEATSGSVSGVISPASAASDITLYNSTDTLSTYADTVSGSFLIRGVPEGLYSMLVESRNNEYTDSLVTSVDVALGNATVLDTLFLTPKN
ncbi:DUF4382 domain-containing protein [bacterium]|nr:MAG: DUF4382 domain-containing protein [bacterium]